MASADPAITRLLQSWRSGTPGAQDELAAAVYDRLIRLANNHLSRERPGHTLAPTALVHEAYLKIAGAALDWQDRSHFFAVASTAMRRVLVDHAKHHKRQRRGGGARATELEDALVIGGEPDPAILEIDETLRRLEKMDPCKVQVVELIFFGGLSYAETGEVLGISEATVKRELRMAKAWIRSELERKPGVPDGAGQ